MSQPKNDRRQSSFPFRLTEKSHRGRVESLRPEHEPDVFDVVPPLADVVHLEACLELDEHASPFLKVLLWHPTNEDDRRTREVLVTLLRQQAMSRPIQCQCCGRIHSATYRGYTR